MLTLSNNKSKMMSMTKNRSDRYPNGYAPKIEYWSGKFLNALTQEEKEYAHQKLTYFLQREAQRRTNNL